jgi:protein ImuA
MEHSEHRMIADPPRPLLRLAPGGPALALGRAHEASGPARRVFAALAAGRLAGPVLWILGGRSPGRLDPEGLLAFFDPSRLVVARCPHGAEALWAAEEALRSGAVALTVLEPAAPPGLTPVRRLQLAAGAGAAAGGAMAGAGAAPPLCLILTPEVGSAAAVETRWRAEPLPGWARSAAPGGGPARWRFALLRDKAGPPAAWEAVAPGRAAAAPAYARAAA